MTTAAEQTADAKKEALKARTEEMNARQAGLNSERTGKGLRVFLGMTRGKGSTEIQYENWDVEKEIDKGDSLPTSLSEFMDALKTRGVSDASMESEVVRRLILGDNEILYKEASDPVAEFVDATWPEDVQKSFKSVVKNYARDSGASIEDAVALIKPGIEAGVAKRKAEVSAEPSA